MDNKHHFNSADILITNGGASSLSESIALNIPSVIIPFENHSEQFLNSKQAECTGLGIIANKHNIVDKTIELYEHFDLYSKNHYEFSIPTNGAEKAASIVSVFLSTPRG